MPSSSRRKQSKPQHVANEKGLCEGKEEQGRITSSPHSADHHLTSNNTSTDVTTETAESADLDTVNGNSLEDCDLNQGHSYTVNSEDTAQSYTDEMDCEPHDLSNKAKVKDTYKGQTVEPTEYASEFQQSGEDSYRHCSECSLSFKSKSSLEQHLITSHGSEPVNTNIAQQASPPPRKRYLEEAESLDQVPSTHAETFSHNDYGTSTSHSADDGAYNLASKRARYEGHVPSLQYNSSAIPPHLEAIYDRSGAGRVGEERGATGDGLDNKLILTHTCPVCAKLFPKASDLKRHMMCHTGEKPFRCQYCQKPFRAKSSMHYHLKATHGVEIELSPGLEERYLRMKTRAQMNLLQRGGHLPGMSHLYGSESTTFRRDNVDYDTEDDCKSNDSSVYPNSGFGSDVSSSAIKSQGLHGHTGNDDKFALDLSISGKEKYSHRDLQTKIGEVVTYGDESVQKGKLRVLNETILVTKLEGMGLISGEQTTVYKCYLCTNIFSTLSKMQCHLSVHFEKHIVTYQCCFCEETFYVKMQMQNHLRQNHTLDIAGLSIYENGTKGSRSYDHENPFPCKFCRKSFDSEISLHKHARLHLRKRNCYCRSCGKTFNQYTSLQLHISRVHPKISEKSKTGSSWTRNNLNFFLSPLKTKNRKVKGPETCSEMEPLNLANGQSNSSRSFLPSDNVTMVIPRSPPAYNGESSDHGLSQHSSDNNWSETFSEPPHLEAEDGAGEIRSAPKKYLLPKQDTSPRSGHNSWKSRNHHSTSLTSANSDVPLNFAKSDSSHHDSNNNDSSSSSTSQNHRQSPELKLPTSLANPEALMRGYNLNATSHLLMAKALMAHQTLTQHLNSTSQPMIFPPNHLPPSLVAMTQMMSLPVGNAMHGEHVAGTSKSPSPVSHSSSKSETSPEDRENASGAQRMNWGQDKLNSSLWNFNVYSPDTGHTDGRKVTSLSRTHSRLGIVQSPINREAMCKPTTLADGRTIYKCPFCAKEFVSYSDINRHMDFHEDIRPYKCQYCDYYARTNSQLKVHMMRHQGIREFCCKLCNYKGVTQSDLNRHMKSQIHMLKSRNACTYCGEGFVTTKNLEKHLDGNCIVKMQKLNGGLDIPLQERVA